MSLPLNIATQQAITFSGVPYGMPNALCTPINQVIGSRTVRVDVSWTKAPYSASFLKRNVAIDIDLVAQAVNTPLEAIRSVIIDNTYNDVSVFVQFSDTYEAIVCPANAIIGVPVMTSNQKFRLYGNGFFTGRAPQTSFFFSNAPQAAFVIQDAGKFKTSGGLTDIDYTDVPANNGTLFMDIGTPFTDRLVVVIFTGIKQAPLGVANPYTSIALGGGTPDWADSFEDQATGARMIFASKYIPTGITTNFNAAWANVQDLMFAQTYVLFGSTSAIPLDFDGQASVAGGFNATPHATIRTIPGSFSIWGNYENIADQVQPTPQNNIHADSWRYRAAVPAATFRAFSRINESVDIVNIGWRGNIAVGATFI